MTQNDTITPRQERVIRALVESRNITVASKKAGVGRKTIYRWLKQPAFLAALNDARALVMELTTTSLLAGVETALEVMYQVMVEGDETNIRRNAASDWLEKAMRYYTTNNLDKRMRAIEEVYYERKQFSKNREV
jgi:phage terminase small subunit